MWRIVLGAALLLTLALGSSAAACPTCGAKTLLSGVTIDATDSTQALVFLVQPAPGQALPAQRTAVVTPAAVATTAPTAAPAAASSPQPVTDPWTPVRQPMTLLAVLAIAATIAGAYLDRRRALAKATA